MHKQNGGLAFLIVKRTLLVLGLMPLARRSLVVLKPWYGNLLNRWLLLKNRITGGSYTNFYEDMMDRRAMHGRLFSKPAKLITGHPDDPRRKFAVQFLSETGYLNPSSKLLDYGCGAVTTGVNFINFLRKGHYYGADISQKTLDVGRQWIDEFGLGAKESNLIHLPGGSLENLPRIKFDVIFSQDVIPHMRKDDIATLIENLTAYMSAKSVLLITYSDAGETEVEYHNDVVNWSHNLKFFKRITHNLPIRCEIEPRWVGKKYKGVAKNKLLKIQLAG